MPRIIRFKTKEQKKERRANRVRARVVGTLERPRLSVSRSNRHIFVQLIDDQAGKTLVSASDRELISQDKKVPTKVASSELVGQKLAEKAMTQNIKRVVFDRAGYRFTGRVKAVATGARAGGLEF